MNKYYSFENIANFIFIDDSNNFYRFILIYFNFPYYNEIYYYEIGTTKYFKILHK